MTLQPLRMLDMTAELARALIDAAVASADRRGVSLAYSVVDRGGNPVATVRSDGAQLGALSLAGDKAFTAVAFGAPTQRWSESSAPGSGDWGLQGSLGGRATVIPGGVPVFSEGQLIGGLGASGAAANVDHECVSSAVASLGLSSAP